MPKPLGKAEENAVVLKNQLITSDMNKNVPITEAFTSMSRDRTVQCMPEPPKVHLLPQERQMMSFCWSQVPTPL